MQIDLNALDSPERPLTDRRCYIASLALVFTSMQWHMRRGGHNKYKALEQTCLTWEKMQELYSGDLHRMRRSYYIGLAIKTANDFLFSADDFGGDDWWRYYQDFERGTAHG